MDIKLRIKSIIRTLIHFTVLLLLVSGYSQANDVAGVKQNTAVTKSVIANTVELPKSGIKQEVLMREELRSSGRVIDRNTMPKIDRNLGRLATDLDEPEGCLCICRGPGGTDCEGCGCPVPLCPGGYMPPCEEGQVPKLDLKKGVDPRVVNPKIIDQRAIDPKNKMLTR